MHRIDLTRPPMPGILTQASFVELCRTPMRQEVINAFRPVMARAAA
jgi:hypothetical protein